MNRAFALLLLLASSAAAKAPVDRCASPRRLVGTWAGTMKCTSGEYPASFVATRPEGESVCVQGEWKGKTAAPGALGNMRAVTTPKNEVFLMTSGQMTALLNTSEGGRTLVFSPDPNASVIAQMIRFGGSAKLDKAFNAAFVRYTTVTPISPLDTCQGTMRRVAR